MGGSEPATRPGSGSAEGGTAAALPPRVYLWVGAVAVVTRLFYLTQHAASPFFAFPVLDGLYYDTVARLLAEGGSLDAINPGFRPLLYPWLLSRLYALSAGWGPVLALFAQHLLGIASALLVVRLAHRLTAQASTALLAGLLYALAGPPLFFEGELLIASLSSLLGLLFLLACSRLSSRAAGPSAVGAWLAAGASLGLLAQARPNALVVAAAFPLSILVMPHLTLRWRLALPAAGLAGLFACLCSFALLQQPAFGSFQLVTGSGGVNLYLGNKREADGMIPRQDRAVTYGDSYRDSVQVFAREELELKAGPGATPPTAQEISRYWLSRTGDEIAADPAGWLRLMARKAWLLVWNAEIPNNKSYAFMADQEVGLLRVLPVRFWLLFALAPFGAVAVYRTGNRDLLYWLLAFVLLWSAGVVLFFVNSRYRIPLWPALAILAAAGAGALATSWRRGSPGRRARDVAILAVLALVSLVNWPGIELPDPSRDYFYRSAAYLAQGDLPAAAGDARTAAELQPNEAVYAFQVGAVELAAERYEAAEQALRRAGRLKPREPRIWTSLGSALEGQGRYAEAYASYRRAIDQVPEYLPALLNAVLLELRAGRTTLAASRLDAADPPDPAAGEATHVARLCARAFLHRARGEATAAETLLAQARARAPELTERLEAESRIPVTLGSAEVDPE